MVQQDMQLLGNVTKQERPRSAATICACTREHPGRDSDAVLDATARARRGLGLCVLCGLPAAGKSTLTQRLKQQKEWDCFLLPYDELIPLEAFSQSVPGAGLVRDHPLLSRWKSYRQELLVYLEHFLQALLNGDPLCAPASRTEATWERFISCFREQGLISPDVPDAKSCRYVINATASRPLCFILDDNFYYQSMRYEVYQLARKYSLGFCQLFLDCPLECCLQRNRARSQPLPDEIICLMAKKIEAPNLDKNTWEQNSLTLKGLEYTSEDNLQVISLLVTALKNPVKQIEENIEQKAADRAICAASILHQADQTFRRMISQTMKDAKDKNVLSSEMKILAEELNKLKAEFLEDLRQGNNQKYQVWLTNSEFPSKVTTSFQQESDNIVKKYIF